MLAFQSDKAQEVKKFIISFIEEAWYDTVNKKCW